MLIKTPQTKDLGYVITDISRNETEIIKKIGTINNIFGNKKDANIKRVKQ